MDYPKSTPNVGLVGGKFVDENTSTGQAGSLIPATWGNSVTDELLAVIVAAGLTPSESDLTQLQKAIQTLAASDVKRTVRVATTGAIALSGVQTIDGVALAVGNRVLVKDQAAGSQNGIYTVAAGAWVRALDANESAECVPGHLVIVESGTAHGGAIWQLSNTTLPTLGTTALVYVRVFGKTGVAAGTYRSVTIDVQGRVTAGSNPTTLAGYGITDVYTKTQVDSLLAGKADNATTLAGYGITDAYTQSQVNTLLAAKAPLASPAFTGSPTVPTAAAGTNNLQAANTAFVQAAIAALVASSPAALDTLKELADAIGNDPNFATTMLNLLAGKANKANTLAGYGIADSYTKTEAVDAVRDIAFRARASLPPATTGVNFNNIVTPGCYEYIVYGTHPNGPGVAAYFYVEVYEYSGGTLTQRLIPYTAKGGTYTRNRYDGVWSDWDKDVTEYSLPGLIPTATGSRAGILKLNHSITSDDQATAASSYALKLVRDLAYNKGSPNTASLLPNGWSKDPDTGEIEQWGVVTGLADNTLVSVTFPIAFPVECLNGSTTFASDPGTSGSDVTGFISPTKTGFTLRVSGNNTNNSVYWRAKGR